MEIKRLHNREIDKNKWDDFISQSPQGAIYALSDYLNIIHAEWEAIIIEKSGDWVAVLPWFEKYKFGIKSVFQPALCQHQGVFLQNNSLTGYAQLEWQRKIGVQLAQEIDANCKRFNTNFSPQYHYVLPFYWRGFALTPRFTYVVSLPVQTTDFSKHHQRALAKANQHNFTLKENQSATQVVNLFKQNKGGQIKLLSDAHYNKIEQLVHAFMPKEQAFVLTCENNNNEMMAGMIGFSFKGVFTYYIGTVTNAGKEAQAMTWLMHQAMQFAHTKGCHSFDFEGSMMEPIEKFFRGFGAHFKPYYNIQKKWPKV